MVKGQVIYCEPDKRRIMDKVNLVEIGGEIEQASLTDVDYFKKHFGNKCKYS